MAHKANKLTSAIARTLPWVLVVAGIALLGWPVATDWYHARQAEESISEILSVYDDMDDPDRLENLAQARSWNARMRGESGDVASDAIWDYSNQLTYKGTPSTMMAWVDIPKISTRLPIFHGTSPDVLSAGVGHLEWTALPVGGEGSRCVLSAHSGMQDTRMFDDIRKLAPGDTFVVWTLNEPYAYRVCDIETILPEEVERLAAEPGRDLCTLMTCTPYSVNTHRLLVTGERCEYVEEPQTEGVSPYVNRRTIPLLAGCAALAALGVLLVALKARRRRRARASGDS